MGRMDITHKIATQLTDAINRVDFAVGQVVYLVGNASPRHRVVLMRMAMHIVAHLSVQYDIGDFGDDDDETRALILAKKITDSVDITVAP